MTIILTFGLVISACANPEDGGDSSVDGDEASEEDGVVTLDLWNRYPELRAPFDRLIEGFEEEHPDIKINKQDLPLESHEAQFQTALSDNSLPDLFTTAADLQELVEVDAVKDLDEVFTDEVRGEFVEGTWWENGTTLDGTAYVFPFVSPKSGAMVMYYNLDVLEQYGLSEDDIPQTWEEFIEVGNTIYEESGESIYPLAWNNEAWSNDSLVNMMGTAISPNTPWRFDYTEGQPSISTEGKVESAEYLKQLQQENIMDPTSTEVSTIDAEANFAAGNNAFWFSGNWTGTQLYNDHGFENWGVAELPTKDGEPYYYPAARQADGLQVSNNTEHWEEVKVFLEYALDNLHEELYVKSGTGVPAKKDVGGEPPYDQYNDIVALMEELAIPVPKPAQDNLNTVEFERSYNDSLGFAGIGDPVVGYLAGAVDDIEAEIEELDEQAQGTFETTLEEYPDVSSDDYKFPNWEPFTPYTLDDYEELD